MLHRLECDASEATHGKLVSLFSFGVGCSRVADNLSLACNTGAICCVLHKQLWLGPLVSRAQRRSVFRIAARDVVVRRQLETATESADEPYWWVSDRFKIVSAFCGTASVASPAGVCCILQRYTRSYVARWRVTVISVLATIVASRAFAAYLLCSWLLNGLLKFLSVGG